MAGIPVHSAAPINVNGTSVPQATPTTTAEPTRVQNGPASTTANTTAIFYNSSASAQPGASAVPAPTGTVGAYATNSPTRTVPPPPTAASNAPPPPQPGQVPTALGSTAYTAPGPSPPSPRAAARPERSAPPLSAIQTGLVNHAPPLPPSPYYHSPTRAQPPAGLTSIPHDLSHPPGYRQDHRASFDDRVVQDAENRTRHTPSPTRRGRGLLDEEPIKEADGDDSLWNTAKSWAKAAGDTVIEGEAQVWKLLNGEK